MQINFPHTTTATTSAHHLPDPVTSNDIHCLFGCVTNFRADFGLSNCFRFFRSFFGFAGFCRACCYRFGFKSLNFSPFFALLCCFQASFIPSPPRQWTRNPLQPTPWRSTLLSCSSPRPWNRRRCCPLWNASARSTHS